MNGLMCGSSNCAPRVLSVLRIVVGLLFMEHGGQKLLGFPAPMPMAGNAPPWVLIAGLLEFGGGALFVLGLFTRPVAFILSGQMAVAYFMGHAFTSKDPNAWSPLVNKGELAVLYCFVFFYFFFAGGGAWSFDNCICKSKRGKNEAPPV